MTQKAVLIVGAGSGLSASLARAFNSKGMKIVLAARNIDKLDSLKKEIDALVFKCDSTENKSVQNLFLQTDSIIGTPEIVIYNPSLRIVKPFIEYDPDEMLQSIKVNSYGAFLVAHESVKRMLKIGKGNIFFTGSSASVKGFAKSASFAMGKFGLRGLAQSLARELHPQNIHIGHFVIDGGIGKEPVGNYQMIHPDEIAKQYLNFYLQDKKAWSWEIEIRTNTEKF
ncbi:MAG: SDR family oxidoreductase [Pelagibacteraceae bacterium]|jgi:short-subunit dehydrogenase|nr:MAG: SDR family oxidoreductase [Pelagibacteraceae bacterium]|tara:strand:- start:351 stop:1028 length:678 start_codon:yes stop_codon:yes gene_type:complete